MRAHLLLYATVVAACLCLSAARRVDIVHTLTERAVATSAAQLPIPLNALIDNNNYKALRMGDLIEKTFVIDPNAPAPKWLGIFLQGAVNVETKEEFAFKNAGDLDKLHKAGGSYKLKLAILSRKVQKDKGLLFSVDAITKQGKRFRGPTARDEANRKTAAMPLTSWGGDLEWIIGAKYLGNHPTDIVPKTACIIGTPYMIVQAKPSLELETQYAISALRKMIRADMGLDPKVRFMNADPNSQDAIGDDLTDCEVLFVVGHQLSADTFVPFMDKLVGPDKKNPRLKFRKLHIMSCFCDPNVFLGADVMQGKTLGFCGGNLELFGDIQEAAVLNLVPDPAATSKFGIVLYPANKSAQRFTGQGPAMRNAKKAEEAVAKKRDAEAPFTVNTVDDLTADEAVLTQWAALRKSVVDGAPKKEAFSDPAQRAFTGKLRPDGDFETTLIG